MSFKRSSRLLASAVVSTGLAVGGLSAATTTPAAAATTSTTYSCTFPVVGNIDVPVLLDPASLPAELPVGVPVPAGSLPMTATLDLPLLLVTELLLHTGAIALSSSDFSVLVGSVPVPAALSAPLTTLPVLSGLSVPLTGSMGSFTPTVPGSLPVSLPTSFNLAGLPLALVGGTGLVPCTLKTPGTNTVKTVTVTKQASTVQAKVLKKPVAQGKRAKVLVTVRNQRGQAATGTVIAKVRGGKQVAKGTLANGQVKLKLKKLAVGKWKVKILYLGNATTTGSKDRVRVRVVR